MSTWLPWRQRADLAPLIDVHEQTVPGGALDIAAVRGLWPPLAEQLMAVWMERPAPDPAAPTTGTRPRREPATGGMASAGRGRAAS